MTLRYAHVGDREIVAAAKRIGHAISRALDRPRLTGRRFGAHARKADGSAEGPAVPAALIRPGSLREI